MAPFVLVHIAVMIYAVQGGLTAAEILSRTQGSFFWMLFYGIFVLTAAVHSSIGLRVIMHEWFGLNKFALTAFSLMFGCLLALMGLRAVWAVTA